MEELNDSGFSLAELADLDVSDIEEVRYVAIPQGSYDFEIVNADFMEDTKDGETRFKAEVELKIIEAKAILEPGHNPDDFVGKAHTERFFIKPADEQEKVLAAIGRIRAFVTDVGMDSKGKLGDIVRNLKGHTFSAKIVNQRNKDDPSNPYKRLKLEPGKN